MGSPWVGKEGGLPQYTQSQKVWRLGKNKWTFSYSCRNGQNWGGSMHGALCFLVIEFLVKIISFQPKMWGVGKCRIYLLEFMSNLDTFIPLRSSVKFCGGWFYFFLNISCDLGN